ncbi:hypothetical protein D3C72_1977350 [compost metagenome]
MRGMRGGGARLPAGLAAVAGQRRQCVGGGQHVDVVPVQAGAQCQVFDAVERTLGARGLDAQRGRFAHALDAAQAQAHARMLRPGAGLRVGDIGLHRLQRAVPAADGHIHRQHLHAIAAGVLHQLRR